MGGCSCNIYADSENPYRSKWLSFTILYRLSKHNLTGFSLSTICPWDGVVRAKKTLPILYCPVTHYYIRTSLKSRISSFTNSENSRGFLLKVLLHGGFCFNPIFVMPSKVTSHSLSFVNLRRYLPRILTSIDVG